MSTSDQNIESLQNLISALTQQLSDVTLIQHNAEKMETNTIAVSTSKVELNNDVYSFNTESQAFVYSNINTNFKVT